MNTAYCLRCIQLPALVHSFQLCNKTFYVNTQGYCAHSYVTHTQTGNEQKNIQLLFDD